MAEDNWWANDAFATAASANSARSSPPPAQQGGPLTLDAPATTPKGQAAQAAFTKVAATRAMRKQLNHVHDLYERDMSAKGAFGLKEYNPFRQANQEFDGAVAAVPLMARQAFRVAGSGADSDKELKLISDALPSRWGFDGTNKERFRTLDSLTSDMIANNAGLAGYSPAQIKALVAEGRYVPPSQRNLPKPPPRGARLPAQAGWSARKLP